VTNCTHWIQCANRHNYCPVLPGDTRITMIEVPPIRNPVKDLATKLQHEASDFLAILLDIDIPPSGVRLALPVIESATKRAVQMTNSDPIQQFLTQFMEPCDGYLTEAAAMYSEFIKAYPDTQIKRHGFNRAIPPRFPQGRSNTNKVAFGNLRFLEDAGVSICMGDRELILTRSGRFIGKVST